jgi:hypothetical protein
MSLTYVKKMSDWSFKCFGMWHNADRRSVNVHQHWHVSYSRKLRNFSSPTVGASYVARWMITYLCWDCSLNKHYNVCDVLLQFTGIMFAKILCEITKVGQINEHIKMHHIDFHFLLNCISFSCYTHLKVFRLTVESFYLSKHVYTLVNNALNCNRILF